MEVSLHGKLLVLIGLLLFLVGCFPEFLALPGCLSITSLWLDRIGGGVAAQQLDSSMSFSFTSAILNSVNGWRWWHESPKEFTVHALIHGSYIYICINIYIYMYVCVRVFSREMRKITHMKSNHANTRFAREPLKWLELLEVCFFLHLLRDETWWNGVSDLESHKAKPNWGV